MTEPRPGSGAFIDHIRRAPTRLVPLGLLLAFGVWPSVAQEPRPPSEPEVIHLEPVPVAPGAGSSAPLGSQPDPSSGSDVVPPPTQGMNAREILAGLWFNYQALRQRGAEQEAATLIGAAIGFMQREGLQAAPEIAAAFLFDGRRALRNGDDDRAIAAFRLASRFDPALSSAHFALAGTLLLHEHDLRGGIEAWWEGVRAWVGDPESMFHLLGRSLLVLYLGSCWGAALALGLIGLKSIPALVHDLRERMGGRASALLAPLLGGVILIAPLLLPVPLPWLLAFWAAIFFAYSRGAERAILVATLGGWLLAGPFGSALAWHVETATDPVARALLQSARAGSDLRHESVFQRVTRERPEDPVYLFLLASAYRVGGHFDVAMSMYRQVLEIDPANARAMINLGNLNALRQEFAQAQALYQKAAEADPANALSHYNSHLAHFESFNLEAADEEIRRARQVDDALVTRLLAQAGKGQMKRSPQDSLYPRRDIWKRALGIRLERRLGAEAARSLMNTTTLASGVGLLAAFLLPGLAMAPRSGGARICVRCGRPFCRRCQVVTRTPGTCSQCVHLFVLKDGLAPAVRDRKKAEVVRHSRRQFFLTRAASLILPGSGHVLMGRPILGTFLLCAWACAGIGLLLRTRLLDPPGHFQSAALTGGFTLLLGLALLTWLVANLSQQEQRAE